MLSIVLRTASFQALLVFGLACLAFVPSLWNGFALDDLPNIIENRALLRPLSEIWFSPAPPGTLFRPLTLFSYGITYQLWGHNPFPYHLANILLHALVSVLALLLLRRVRLDALAFPVAAMFAVHPLHTEVVANVSGRAELLAAALGLASLLLLLGARDDTSVTPLRGFASGTLFLGALLSKESGMVILPLAFLCLYREYGKRKQLYSCLPLMLVAAFFLWWRASVLGWWGGAAHGVLPLDNPLVLLSGESRIPVALALLGKYLSMLFLPYPLSADYSLNMIVPQEFWADAENVAALMLSLSLLAAAVLSVPARGGLFFCTAWFFLAFAITSNALFPIGTIFGERLAYLPSIGGIGALVYCGQQFMAWWQRRMLATLLLLAFMWVSSQHSLVWASNEALHSYQVRVSCRSAKTLHNYGVLMRNKGALDDAQVLFHAALREYPDFADAAQGLGSVYALKGLPSGAMHWYNRALEIEPRHQAAREGRARVYLALGKLDDARREFERMRLHDPGSLAARVGLLAILIAEKRWDEAKLLRDELLAEGHKNSELKALDNRLSSESP